jgi:hypothetical protein
MGDTLITNPSAAYRTVTDYRTGQDADGFDLEMGKSEVYHLRANATITKGEALMFVAATASVPTSVTPMTAAADVSLFAGVALEGAASGDLVTFARRGFVIVQTEDADTPAFGNILRAPDTVTGDFGASGALGAGGEALGLVLGPEIGSTNTALAFLDPVIFPQTA